MLASDLNSEAFNAGLRRGALLLNAGFGTCGS